MRGRGRRPLRCRRSAARARGPRGRAWAPRASGVSRAGTREGRARTRRNRVPPRESAREGRGPDGWQGGGSGSGSRAARSGERAAPGAQDAGRPAATTPARSHCAAALAPPCCGASRGNGVSRSFPRARRGSGGRGPAEALRNEREGPSAGSGASTGPCGGVQARHGSAAGRGSARRREGRGEEQRPVRRRGRLQAPRGPVSEGKPDSSDRRSFPCLPERRPEREPEDCFPTEPARPARLLERRAPSAVVSELARDPPAPLLNTGSLHAASLSWGFTTPKRKTICV